MTREGLCFFHGRPGAGPCSGRLVKAHLIPKQLITRELRSRRTRLQREGVDGIGALLVVPESMDAMVLWDPRVWVPVCGGPMGNAGHHGAFDSARTLRLLRADLPPELEEYAAELGLGWWLDREYGEREVAA